MKNFFNLSADGDGAGQTHCTCFHQSNYNIMIVRKRAASHDSSHPVSDRVLYTIWQQTAKNRVTELYVIQTAGTYGWQNRKWEEMRFSLGENKAKMTNEQQEQKMNIQYIKIKILKCILNTFILLYAKDKILSSTLVQLQHCFWTTTMHLVQN